MKRPAPPKRKSGTFCHAETTLFSFNLLPYSLETDERPEGYARIMMCACGKVDFISSFKPQAHGADVAFQTCARIEHGAHVVRTQVIDRTYESSLQCYERANCTVTSDELWAKETVQHFEIAVLESDGAAARVREPFRENLVEVVTHLTFQHQVRERFYPHTCSQSCHVALGLRDAEVIGVSAQLKTILR